jgi:hypothetical protein
MVVETGNSERTSDYLGFLFLANQLTGMALLRSYYQADVEFGKREGVVA